MTSFCNYWQVHSLSLLYFFVTLYHQCLILEMNNILPKFRWRRSKWGRYCPVELTQGNLVPGRMEFAVGLVKIQCTGYAPLTLYTALKLDENTE